MDTQADLMIIKLYIKLLYDHVYCVVCSSVEMMKVQVYFSY